MAVYHRKFYPGYRGDPTSHRRSERLDILRVPRLVVMDENDPDFRR
jgi:hypothetical protein